MEHEVHGRDAEHGHIEVKAVEHVRLDVLAVGLQEVAGEDPVDFAVLTLLLGDALGGGVLLQEVVHDGDEEARGAAGRVGDAVGGLGLHEIDHEADDVPRRAELAVDAGGGELAEQVFVEVALGVAPIEGKRLDHVHRCAEQ